MKKKKFIIPVLSIALIGAGIACYALFYSTNYRKAVNTCVSRFMADYEGGKVEEYKEYCECFVTAPQKVMTKEAYNEWLEIYIKDKEAARDMALDKKFNFQPQFECMMEKGPLEMWLETLWKLYKDVDGLSEEDATCVLAKIVTSTDGEENFINFAKMKFLDKAGETDGMESFKFAEKKIKESCIACRSLDDNLEDIKDINKNIKDPLTGELEPPIIVAVKYECYLDDILKLQPKLNIAPKDKETGWRISPLMWAALMGREETMEKLLENGAQIDYQEAETGYTALMYAAQLNKPDSVRFLLDHGANYDLESKDGAMALMLAMQEDNVEIVDMLMEKGAKMNLKLIDPAGYDFLTVLSDRASPKIVEIAIKMGANVNEQNAANKRTALMIAAMSDRIEVMKVLLENGADPNIVDKNLYSPLMVASIRNNYEIVKLLVEHGAKLNLKNRGGETALMLAQNQDEKDQNEDNKKIIELLEKSKG